MMLNRIFKPLLGLAVAAATLAAAAPAQAAPQWLTPQTLSQPGQDASKQQVAFDQGGDAVAVWQSSGGPQTGHHGRRASRGRRLQRCANALRPQRLFDVPRRRQRRTRQLNRGVAALRWCQRARPGRLPTRRGLLRGARRRCRPQAMKQGNHAWR